MIKSKVTGIQVLARATELLSKKTTAEDGTGWTRHVFARDAAGWTVQLESPEACQFCSLGAIGRAAFELKAETEVAVDAEMRLDRMLHGADIVNINDSPSTTYSQIILAFKLAQTEAGDC